MDTALETITILVVDDQAAERRQLCAFLNAQTGLQVVAEANDGDEAVALAAALAPDVCLMNLALPPEQPARAAPGASVAGRTTAAASSSAAASTTAAAIEAIRRLRTASPHTQVVAFTDYPGDETIFPTLRAGAISYVVKDASSLDPAAAPANLAAAVLRAARGQATLQPRIAARIVQEVAQLSSHSRDPLADLTQREVEILQLIAAGLNETAIAAQLGLEERRVQGHITNALSKLHLSGRAQAAVRAWKEDPLTTAPAPPNRPAKAPAAPNPSARR